MQSIININVIVNVSTCIVHHCMATPSRCASTVRTKLCLVDDWNHLWWSSDCRQGPEDRSRRTDQQRQKPGGSRTYWVGDVVRAEDFAQRNRDVSGCTVGHSERRGTEMSGHSGIDGPWPPCLKFKRYSISDVKPVELLMEQLAEPSIVFACVAHDARGSIEYSLELVSKSPRSTGENRITV